MRYAQGGGLTAEGRRRRELVRLAAVGKFEQRVPVAEIAAELRVSERSVQRWRPAVLAGRPRARAGLEGEPAAAHLTKPDTLRCHRTAAGVPVACPIER